MPRDRDQDHHDDQACAAERSCGTPSIAVAGQYGQRAWNMCRARTPLRSPEPTNVRTEAPRYCDGSGSIDEVRTLGSAYASGPRPGSDREGRR